MMLSNNFTSSPRSSESSNPMRKSFAGNPFSKPSVMANPRSIFPNTPANSPSGFPRRNGVACRESIGSLQDLDDKENGKDQILKSAKARSPAASSKGTKNFMSPTISASCKIAESPRKKVLIERNEHGPSSVPSAETKNHVRKVTFAEPLECGDLEEKKLDALFDGVPNFEETQSSCLTFEDFSGESEIVHDDASVPLVPKNDTDLSLDGAQDRNVPLVLENDIDTEPSFEPISQEHDGVNLDPTFRLSPTPPPASSTASILAPLDADPLMPPYDPKTNYLSPRPQFLHYKPKPRMELCSESIISASFSDTEVTEDTHSEGSQKESEDVSSDEIFKEEETQISEPISPPRIFMPDETVEGKEVPKCRFSMRSMAFGMILLLLVISLSISVTNPPVIDRFSQLAKENYDGLARNFHILSTKSLSSMSDLISNVRGLHIHSLAQLQYFNLTVLRDHDVVNQHSVFGPDKNEIVDTPKMHPPILHVQESGAAAEIDTDLDIEDLSAEHYEIYEEQLQQDWGVITMVENASEAPESVEVLHDQATPIIESEHSLQVAEAGNSEAKQEQEDYGNMFVENTSELEQAQEDDANFNVENQQGLSSEASEIHIDVRGSGDLDTKHVQENDGKFDFDEPSNSGAKNLLSLDSDPAEIHPEVYEDEAEGNSLPLDAAIRGNDQGSKTTDSPPSKVLYLFLCGGAVIIASAAFNYAKKSKRERVSPVEKPGDESQALKKQISPEKPSLRTGPTEMDMFGEPCPSEMSSFQKSSSPYGKRMEKQLNESQKRKSSNYRRESLASTTSDYSIGSSSPSYGSLTVFEKIQRKQGDEGTVTPVRRSSRIRNLVTSPI